MADIYTRVTELEEQVADLTEQLAGLTPNDSGWLPLTLLNGVIAYGNGANVPRYRKIGNTVYLTGAVKNITARATVIATLPEGFRPVNGYPFVQNTSHENNIAQFIRWNITSSGDITMAYDSATDISADDWFPIATSFIID